MSRSHHGHPRRLTGPAQKGALRLSVSRSRGKEKGRLVHGHLCCSLSTLQRGLAGHPIIQAALRCHCPRIRIRSLPGVQDRPSAMCSHLTQAQLPFNRLAANHTRGVPLLGVRPGVTPIFTADVERRDMVVEAFKVCTYLGPVVYVSSPYTARLVGVR